MKLEQWLDDYDIKKMVIRDLKYYLLRYKEEDFNELFKDMDLDKVQYAFHSVAYVISEWYNCGNKKGKYISARVRLEYDDSVFAEYEAIYSLDGEIQDDYLKME
ncbi:MAG: hypothetical protein HFH67_16735 [Lachnospiraceae bacterium]|nr:hypothetical protein [Lachnospiraceae bacterium]